MRLIPFLAAAALAAEPSLDLTVYNNDLALVKDHRTLELAKGRSSLPWRTLAQTLDASSASFSSPGARVLEQNYRYDLVSRAVLLQKYLGREVKLVQEVQAQDAARSRPKRWGRSFRWKGRRSPRWSPTAASCWIRRGACPAALPEGLLVRPALSWTCKAPGGQGGRRTALPLQGAVLARRLHRGARFAGSLPGPGRPGDPFQPLGNRVSRRPAQAGGRRRQPDPREGRRPVFRKASMSMDLGSAGGIEDDGFSEQGLMEYHLYSVGAPPPSWTTNRSK